jgi:hypothetical protein
MKIQHAQPPRKGGSLLSDAARDEIRAVVREELARASHPRFARLADLGLSSRQRATLEREGVTFVRVAKYWMVDVATFEAYVERQRVVREDNVAELEPAADALAHVDPAIRAAYERAAKGGAA